MLNLLKYKCGLNGDRRCFYRQSPRRPCSVSESWETCIYSNGKDIEIGRLTAQVAKYRAFVIKVASKYPCCEKLFDCGLILEAGRLLEEDQ